MKSQYLLSVAVVATVLGLGHAACADLWIAGRDLAANERPNGPQELINPNPTVPEWSYGFRSGISGTAFTPFTTHFNDESGIADMDGWGDPAGHIFVNTGMSPVIEDPGFGPNDPINPGEMHWHPSPANNVVLRWIAPFSATFAVNAYWDDMDPHGGNGASGDVVVNGISLYHQAWGNGGGATTPTLMIPLMAGGIIDFVEDAVGGDHSFDGTLFDATIVGVPELSGFLLSSLPASCLALALVKRRAKRGRNQ